MAGLRPDASIGRYLGRSGCVPSCGTCRGVPSGSPSCAATGVPWRKTDCWSNIGGPTVGLSIELATDDDAGTADEQERRAGPGAWPRLARKAPGMMCERALSRTTQGSLLAGKQSRPGLHRRLPRPAHPVPAARPVHRVVDRQARLRAAGDDVKLRAFGSIMLEHVPGAAVLAESRDLTVVTAPAAGMTTPILPVGPQGRPGRGCPAVAGQVRRSGAGA